MRELDEMIILAIDDDAFSLAMMADVLGDMATIVCEQGGERGLLAAAVQRPDLILCDVAMPGIDGHAVCRQLQADSETKHIPIVCVSALETEADEIAALTAGALDFIRKPLTAPLLRAKVRAHLERSAQSSHMWNLARRDGLTGLSNRRYFDERFEREWARQRRSGQFLALGMVDLDRFKAFNDLYGHVTGDECRRWVANVVAGCAKRRDELAARYGGEEFVFLLPGMDADAAGRFGAFVCAAISQMARPHEQSEFGIVTASVGMASVRPSATLEPKDVLRMADQALYEAKAAGRNQCATAGGPWNSARR